MVAALLTMMCANKPGAALPPEIGSDGFPATITFFSSRAAPLSINCGRRAYFFWTLLTTYRQLGSHS